VDSSGDRLLREFATMLREVTGESEAWAAGITAASRLEDDLLLESVDVVALGERLRRRYGEPADPTAFIAGLGIDELIALTVGDLMAFVTRRVPVPAVTDEALRSTMDVTVPGARP
jgi:acyl carrier protein